VVAAFDKFNIGKMEGRLFNIQGIREELEKNIEELFHNPKNFPPDIVQVLSNTHIFKIRLVEHLSGMTDRYLLQEYEKLFLPSQSPLETKDEIQFWD
jgi:dGTP triphosphohydrolase